MSKYLTYNPKSVNTENAHIHEVFVPNSNRNHFLYNFNDVAKYFANVHSIELPEDFREKLKEAHRPHSYAGKNFSIATKALDGIVESSKLWVQTGNILPENLNKLVLHQTCSYVKINCSALATAKPEWFGNVRFVYPFPQKLETVLRENGTFFIYE